MGEPGARFLLSAAVGFVGRKLGGACCVLWLEPSAQVRLHGRLVPIQRTASSELERTRGIRLFN